MGRVCARAVFTPFNSICLVESIQRVEPGRRFVLRKRLKAGEFATSPLYSPTGCGTASIRRVYHHGPRYAARTSNNLSNAVQTGNNTTSFNGEEPRANTQTSQKCSYTVVKLPATRKGPARYHTITEYRREQQLSLLYFVKYPIPIQETGNGLVTPMRLRITTGDGRQLLFRERWRREWCEFVYDQLGAPAAEVERPAKTVDNMIFDVITSYKSMNAGCTHQKARLIVTFCLSRACKRERGTSDREARSA
ncbi:hypothetical protein EVAR_99463_1 [Eumeta japonica]|uniref:Uncharacterized protein n=1 Tax=Eumeta variegata TaxID=151549 RepID=A0A4C1Z5M2_EUMVA|nr:hypothetical protein EVAR_99463_1 [Eumeta japonica]